MILLTEGGGVLSQHALQVVSQHALQQVSGGCLLRGVSAARGCLLPGGLFFGEGSALGSVCYWGFCWGEGSALGCVSAPGVWPSVMVFWCGLLVWPSGLVAF